MGFFRDLAASIIAKHAGGAVFVLSPDKAKYFKELSEQMPSDADIKRQQAPRSLKAEEAFSGDFEQGGKGKRLKMNTERNALSLNSSKSTLWTFGQSWCTT